MPGTVQELVERLAGDSTAATEADLVRLLQCTGAGQERLYAAADEVRRRNVGDEVFLRGIIEFSNYCRKSCRYCGIRGPNRRLQRYRLKPEEIVKLAVRAWELGNTTVVLQSGEDPWFTADRVCAILQAIKARADVAITLSIGERPEAELVRFRAAGCDRYLLRFETSDRALFRRFHPDTDFDARLRCLADIRRAGIQVGSGFLIGLPGADASTVARDILFATALELDMIGCGPYLPHPDTPLAGHPLLDDRELYFKTIALLRLLNPRAHIPATTAFDALLPGGRDLALQRGANVFMPNMTPRKYRELYALYPGKPCVDQDSAEGMRGVVERLARLGRPVGTGPGHSLRR